MQVSLITSEVLEHCQNLAYTGFDEIGKYLIHNPAIAIFICLGLGYLLGKVKIKSFTVGSTVGTLLVGLLLSFILVPVGDFDINPLVKSVFFTLFIFTIGYEVGPTFFRSLKSNGIKVVILSTVFAVVAFAVCYGIFKALSTNPGEAAGVVAGALTQSAVLGTAGETIKTVLSGSSQDDALSQMAIAYAITYVFGTVGVIVFMKNVAPKLLGVDIKQATAKKIADSGFKENTSSTVISHIKARAFRVNSNCQFVGKTVGSFEDKFEDKLSIEMIYRDDKVYSFDENTIIQANDVLTFIGNLTSMVAIEEMAMEEVADDQYLRITPYRGEVVLTKSFNPDVLKHLSQQGIVISSAQENGKEIKNFAQLKQGDEIVLVGPKKMIDKVVKSMGYIKDTGMATDVSFLSIGIVVGLLIGAICFKIKGVPITLGGGGGALVGGLLFGWYQNKKANHGYIPAATRWFLKSVGLNLFIAVVGLTAGSSFLTALQQMGASVLLLGVVITLVPHIVSLFFGKLVLKMDPVDIIGGLCGAGTCTAALNGVIDETGSSVFAMGYTPGYAVGNILITVLGPLIVSLLS